MEKQTKIILGVFGGLILAAGLSFGIYQLPKSKVVTSGGGSGSGPGPDPTPAPPPKDSPEAKALAALNLLLQGYQQIKAFTAESFPLRAGMKGNRVKEMQANLVAKFNQFNVKQDGIFGVETFKALKNIGYASLLDNTINSQEYSDIQAGIKKS